MKIIRRAVEVVFQAERGRVFGLQVGGELLGRRRRVLAKSKLASLRIRWRMLHAVVHG